MTAQATDDWMGLVRVVAAAAAVVREVRGLGEGGCVRMFTLSAMF